MVLERRHLLVTSREARNETFFGAFLTTFGTGDGKFWFVKVDNDSYVTVGSGGVSTGRCTGTGANA